MHYSHPILFHVLFVPYKYAKIHLSLDEDTSATAAAIPPCPASPLQSRPDVWNIEALRSRLEDATNTGPALRPEVNAETNDFYYAWEDSDDGINSIYTSREDLYWNNEDQIINKRVLEKPAYINSSLINPHSASEVARHPITRSQSRIAASQSPRHSSSALLRSYGFPILQVYPEKEDSARITISPNRSQTPTGEIPSHGYSSPLSLLLGDWQEEHSLFSDIEKGEDDKTTRNKKSNESNAEENPIQSQSQESILHILADASTQQAPTVVNTVQLLHGSRHRC